MSVALIERVLRQIETSDLHDVTVSLAGCGDPLLHPAFDQIIRMARNCGIRGIHVRTELLCDRPIIDRLLAAQPDVVSIDLHADRAATYLRMMGCDRFKEALLNMDHLIQRRHRLTEHPGTAGLCLPWVVPHLQRRTETYEDIDSFFDRWQHMLGTAVIEGPPADEAVRDALTPAVTPQRVRYRDLCCEMTILCDGSAPMNPLDRSGATSAGNIADAPLHELWGAVVAGRPASVAALHPGRH